MESLYPPYRKIQIGFPRAVLFLALAGGPAIAQEAPAPVEREVALQEELAEEALTRTETDSESGASPDDPFADTVFDSAWSSSGIKSLDENKEHQELTPGEVISIESSIEQWVKELLQPFVPANEYSVYVDVTVNPDPYRLRTYREKMDQLGLPGLPAIADDAGHPRENPLFSMIEKKKLILVFFRPVEAGQVELITEILRAKRLIVEARGDSLVINTAVDPGLMDRMSDILSFFTFETEEGQPAWLAPLSALVSVTMIFAFLVLIWQIILLKKGGGIPRQIVVKGARRKRAPSRRPMKPAFLPDGPTAASRLRGVLRGLSGPVRAAASSVRRGLSVGKRGGQSAVRWTRRRMLGQVVPPVWPPKDVFRARHARSPGKGPAPEQAPSSPVSIQILPVGGYFSFRSIATMPRAVVGGALRAVDARTLAVALINEDPDTIEFVLANIREDQRDDLIREAIALDSSGNRDFRQDMLQARNRIAENLALELHRGAEPASV